MGSHLDLVTSSVRIPAMLYWQTLHCRVQVMRRCASGMSSQAQSLRALSTTHLLAPCCARKFDDPELLVVILWSLETVKCWCQPCDPDLDVVATAWLLHGQSETNSAGPSNNFLQHSRSDFSDGVTCNLHSSFLFPLHLVPLLRGQSWISLVHWRT